MKIPECPNYVAHPQSVWFNEHWRPILNKLLKENHSLKDQLTWSLKNEEQYKTALARAFARNIRLRDALEEIECGLYWPNRAERREMTTEQLRETARRALSGEENSQNS